jgi:hypothetical protein
VQEGPRELWVGGSAIEAITAQMIAPALLDRYMARTAWDGQVTQTPNPHAADNLFHPAPGDRGARGRFGARAKPRAAIVDPVRARRAAGLAAIGVLGLAAAAKRLRRA